MVALRLRSLSGYAVGVLVGSLFFGGLTFASTGTVMPISVRYANIGITVNGKKIPTEAQPFIYKGNVYVPISTIAHGLGSEAQWVGAKDEVAIADPHIPSVQQGMVNYYNLPLYSGTHTVSYNGSSYISAFALATVANQPYYLDSATQTAYIGTGPSSGMPLSAFFDTRDYGDYAMSRKGMVGPDYGWGDGAPVIKGIVYPNANSLVWAPQSSTSQVPGVEYNLNGDYTSVTGAFGVDDGSQGTDQAQLTITGDGQQLYQSPWMSKGEAAAPVAVNVTGVHLLTIAFAVQTSAGTVYSMGQAVPANTTIDIDFADVNVH